MHAFIITMLVWFVFLTVCKLLELGALPIAFANDKVKAAQVAGQALSVLTSAAITALAICLLAKGA